MKYQPGVSLTFPVGDHEPVAVSVLMAAADIVVIVVKSTILLVGTPVEPQAKSAHFMFPALPAVTSI
jgi:hypothetical protein